MSNLTEFPAYQRLHGSLAGAHESRLTWSTGRDMLDLYGGHCVNSLGAGNGELAQALAKQRFDQTSQAIKGVGGATGLTRNQLLTLQYTFNDVVASMSTGMSTASRRSSAVRSVSRSL